MDERFRALEIKSWRQFSLIELDLSKQLTVLTGENGTGKSTLLTILADQFSRQQYPFISTPMSVGGEVRYMGAGLFPLFEHRSNTSRIGEVIYDSGQAAAISIEESNKPEFQLTYRPRVSLPGLFLDSHRASGGYQKVDRIPARFSSTEELAKEYETRIRGQQQSTVGTRPPSQALKESLIAAALYAEGNRFVREDSQASTVWNGFQDVLNHLFPKSLEFAQLVVEHGEVLIETRTSAFPLEAASGGLSAIIDLSWQIFLASHNHPVFTVCFDEPENHLHPSLQRSLLPSLLQAFPSVNFIVATHSPFVVSSVREARVYALRRDTEGGVRSDWLDFEDQAYRADEILRDVLGVESTLPIWAERDLNEIVKRFEREPYTEASAREMRDSFREAGLRFTFPDTLPGDVT
jgi:predicted ATPase